MPSDFRSLKSKVDKLDIGKLKATPVDLSNLSDEVKNNAVKKKEYNELVKNLMPLILVDLLKNRL